jgi:cytochrome bd-type quinol oxidase subunit 2
VTIVDLAVLAIDAWVVLALAAWAVAGGTDFGLAGWALLTRATGDADLRESIARAGSPLWIVPHAWLLLAVLLLIGRAPSGVADAGGILLLPIAGLAVGLAARVFVHVSDGRGPLVSPRAAGAQVPGGASAFAAPAAAAPFCAGTALGALATGSVHGNVPLAAGALALALAAFMAVLRLLHRAGDPPSRELRRTAWVTGGVVIAAGALLMVLVPSGGPPLTSILLPAGFVMVAAGAAVGVCCWALLVRRYGAASYAGQALTALLVTAAVAAQSPWLLQGAVPLRDGAAPDGTILFLAIAAPVGAAAVLRSAAALRREATTDQLPPTSSRRIGFLPLQRH